MKKILSIWLLLVLVSTTMSCSKDDNSAEPTLVGTWEWSKIGYIDAAGTITDLSPYSHDCSTNKDSWLFTADGAFITSESNLSCTNYYENYQYILSGTNLNYSDSSITRSFTILSITANTLKVEIPGVTNKAPSRPNYYEFTRRN